jgi:hypothetical protein
MRLATKKAPRANAGKPAQFQFGEASPASRRTVKMISSVSSSACGRPPRPSANDYVSPKEPPPSPQFRR